VAKNQLITALRSSRTKKEASFEPLEDDALRIEATLDEPLETLSRIEQLEALHECVEELSADDRTMASHLPAITERRWVDAARSLGISESTLRSRWKNTLAQLRTCVEGKLGRAFAP
jgi:RNA polymerase sigma factor (sigma-70 family)